MKEPRYFATNKGWGDLAQVLTDLGHDNPLIFPREWLPTRQEALRYLYLCALVSVEKFQGSQADKQLLEDALTRKPSRTRDRLVNKRLGNKRFGHEEPVMRLMVRWWDTSRRGHVTSRPAVSLGKINGATLDMIEVWGLSHIPEQVALEAFAESLCGGLPRTLRGRLEKLRHLTHTTAQEDVSAPVTLRLFLVAWAQSLLPGMELVGDVSQALTHDVEECPRCMGKGANVWGFHSQWYSFDKNCPLCRGRAYVPAGLYCRAAQTLPRCAHNISFLRDAWYSRDKDEASKAHVAHAQDLITNTESCHA